MFVILVTIITILITTVITAVYQKKTNAMCKSKKRLDGKIVIVTGGTAGMGLESAREFARRGAKVIIACPFKEEGESAKRKIIADTGNNKVIFKLLDLASLKSVREFAKEILLSENELHILLNNAGVGIPKEFETSDGLNYLMQVNYFGHFLLTLLLLPLLKKSGTPSEPSRIVNLSSLLHWLGTTEIDKINLTGYWYKLQVYGSSKLCLVLFAHELSKRLKGSNVVVNSVDPGAVGTRIFDSIDVYTGSLLTALANAIYKTPWEGAQTALHVALDQKAGEITGQFFKNCKLSRAKKSAYDDTTAKKLWEESLRLVKMDDSEVQWCFRID